MTCTHQNRIGVEYGYPHPESYDGISEWLCADCGHRQGRWTGRTLVGDDCERRYGRAEGARQSSGRLDGRMGDRNQAVEDRRLK